MTFMQGTDAGGQPRERRGGSRTRLTDTASRSQTVSVAASTPEPAIVIITTSWGPRNAGGPVAGRGMDVTCAARLKVDETA